MIGKPDVVVRLQQQAHHLGDDLVRPGRQAQRPLLSVLLWNVDPLDRSPPVALTAQCDDDRADLLQGHAVRGLTCDPWRHRPVVRVDAPIGHQLQLRIEQWSIQPFEWQSSFTALADDVRHRFGALHYACLPSPDTSITCAPLPCGRLSRPPWWDVTPRQLDLIPRQAAARDARQSAATACATVSTSASDKAWWTGIENMSSEARSARGQLLAA